MNKAYKFQISENDKKYIELILEQVYLHTKFDFREYRESTLARRISRRFFFTGVKTYIEYLSHIKYNTNELYDLVKDLTINVTEFFRDPEYWQIFYDYYSQVIISSAACNKKNEINIWCAGCSTGEETYSIAALLLDLIKKKNLNFKLNIIATDICANYFENAKNGIYPIEKKKSNSILNNYIDLYFTQINNDFFMAADELKNCISFEFHSLTD